MLIGIRGREGSVLRKAFSVLKFVFVFMLLFAAASQFFVSVTVAESGEGEAASALVSAEGAVVSAYQAVLEADEAGANVSGLLVRLNEAGEFLTHARMAYRVEDFDSALDFAVQSRERLNGFVVEADALRGAAMQEHYWDFMVNVAGPIVGAIGVVCGGIVVWFFLKREYERTGSMVE